MSRFLTILKQMDWWMMLSTILLGLAGLMMIYSISSPERVLKQAIAFSVGMVLIFLFAFLDYKVFGHNAYFVYIFSIVLLVLVLFLGQEIRGMKGWFDFGAFQFQPSEFAKVALILVLARYFSKRQARIREIKDILVSGGFTSFLSFLIFLQPDLGSALFLVGLWLFMLLFFGIRKIHGFLLILAFVILGFVSWRFLLVDYQKERILSFVNPLLGPKETSWNIIQSKVAIGSGGLLGRGLGRGPQGQLQFLPEADSDFIFAALAEELGFLGAVLVLGLFLFLIFRMIRAARLAKDDFGLMVCAGSAFLFTLGVVVTVGMNTGLLPIIGIPLPFISYGGTSLVFSLLLVGLVQSIIVRHKTLKFER